MSIRKLACGFVLSFAAMSVSCAFAAGGDWPEGYTEVEYIQGNGNGARIVTDYTPRPETDKIEAVVEWPSGTIAANVNQAVWCARGSGMAVDSWTLFVLGTKFRFDYMPEGHAVSLQPDFNVSAGTKYTITAEDNTITYVANEEVLQTQDTPAYPFTVGSAMELFASHYNGINANLGNYGKHRLYSFKVWRSGKLIHYFVPCKNSAGAATLVDVCENPATMTKAGTFSAGGEGHYYDDSVFGPFKITLNTKTIEYNPLAQGFPEVVVSNRDTGVRLSEGIDYELAYSNANYVGTATIYVTGCGIYAGEKATTSYKIVSDRYLPAGYRQLDSIRSTGTQYIKFSFYIFATEASVLPQ